MPDSERDRLSDVFRFTYSFGQKGHQIGRKTGDAIELLTLGVIDLDENAARHLIIEPGVEGATTARHKVEFAYFNLKRQELHSNDINNLFAIIECKKVGVEQTVKQSFKTWRSRNKGPFSRTEGYSFTINPRWLESYFSISISHHAATTPTLLIKTGKGSGKENERVVPVKPGDRLAFALDVEGQLHFIPPGGELTDSPHPVSVCTIVTIKETDETEVLQIHVDDCLDGPQTTEKAKQAAFVSLDVRKKITGKFDKPANNEDLDFTSVLVIGEASHWEEKSRAMVRLCNDHNLIIPDEVVVEFFKRALATFGDDYQTLIKKNYYVEEQEMKDCMSSVIRKFKSRVLHDMDTGEFVRPVVARNNGKNRLKIIKV